MSEGDAIDLTGPLHGVSYEKNDGIAVITLNRPDRGNSLAPSMMAVVKAIWEDVRDDPDVRVAIVTAAGFADVCAYGSLEGAPYNQEAQRLVVVGRKP